MRTATRDEAVGRKLYDGTNSKWNEDQMFETVSSIALKKGDIFNEDVHRHRALVSAPLLASRNRNLPDEL